MRKLVLSIISIVLAYGLCSCEKAYTDDEGDKDDKENAESGREDNGGWYSDDYEEGDSIYESEFSTGDVVDVTTFRTVPIYAQVWVEGYIVGAATGRNQQYKYEFGPSFTLDTAILLADSEDADSKDEVVSVCLTNCSKTIRQELNLKDHPENKGRRLAVFGFQEMYLKLWGIKHIDAYRLYDD